MLNIKYFLVVHLVFSFCWCEIDNSQKEKLLNGFLQYYNGLPDQVYHSQEGSLLNTQQVDDTTYQIEASIRVADINNAEATKWLKCTATVKDSDTVVTVSNDDCEDAVEQKQSPETTLEAQVEVSEPPVERKPVQLDNEVQADTAITSGEQFIAIPRDQPSAPCVGCATHVNPQAAGVSDLANLGVRHLDLHEPSVKHSLENVIDVERQVQVVNGVRYILTLSIHSNNCTEVESENCASSKVCKITILVKPWVKLSNGGNYRAILANNCTEEWLFGENGEVLPEPSTGDNPVQDNTSVDSGDDNIKIKHNTDVQSQPNQEKILTDDDIKKLQEQIITYAQFQEVTESDRQSFTIAPETADVSKQHVFKIESERHTENSIPVTESEKTEHQAFDINLDKKKAIDEMLDFFDFSGFKPKTDAEDVLPRVRRSYDYDLQVLSLAEDFHGIKNSIENARFMYTMAQAMVDYLNEMDMEVKNRAVKNVIRAEEETENLQRFVYIQARVTIPCDKVECESKDVDTQICNGVLDCSNEKSPQILTSFCYNDNKESDYREDIKEIPLDDPVLRKMAEEAVKKIESESKSQYALRINKIASAVTQVTSGTLTKFSVIVENIKCNKSVSLPLRINCTVLEQLGTKICDVIIHERHWLKEKKMSYTCTDRPADMRISKSKKVNKNVTTEDPEILEMLQEAIQYLESQSDKANKQKIVSIKSISSQIIAGFLTNIEFVVGYTDCIDENYSRDQISKCELLRGEGLRSCKAQIWDRSWIMDGRQIEVSCDDATKNNEVITRKKRSIDSTSDQERSLSKDLDYKQLANESLYKFMQSSSTHQHYEVVKVDKAEVKDVSRKLIKIDFSISPTDCLIEKDGTLSSSDCEIVNPKDIIHCRAKILENNWIDKKQYFVKCKIKYQPHKNVNEVKDRNPSDSKYYKLAEESLAKYLQDTGNPNHVVVRVEKVTTQLVSGLLTRIDFVISPKSQSVNDSKTVRCHSEILEKHWLGTKSLNVSCQMKQNINKIDENVEINIDDPKYMQIAVESLQKYIKNKPESKLVRVAFVDKVLRNGETLIIRFIASHADGGDGDTLCFAELPETIESKREVDVKCHFIGTIFRDAEIIEDDPNYYKYVQLTNDCLNNYLQKTNSSLYTLVGIETVTVEWDEGIKTIIVFNISPDSENSELTQGKHCIAEILQQPWLHKNKIIQDVKCELEKDLYRIKRQVSNVRRQLGAIGKSQDPTDPRYRALAEECLRKYVVDSGITQPLAVVQVDKVATQVVSGNKIFIDFLVTGSSDSTTVKCHSEVWEQVWLNKKEILTVTCQNDDHRSKRGIPGGLTEKDPTEPQYKALAEESLRKYVVDAGITKTLAVALVQRVTTQVVAGSLTRVDFLVTGSSDSTTIKCHSEVWERPWLNKKEINVTCQNYGHRSKRGLVGGQQDQDPTRPQYRVLAEESLRKYVVDAGITQTLAVSVIQKVTTQVVAGSLTRVDFLVTGSSDSTAIKCHSEVWERPWLNEKEINVTCQNDGHRSKRGIPGGLTEQDPTEPQYKALAEESLRKYVVDAGITQTLGVALVERVTTQVVAGSLTHVDFRVTGSSDSTTIKCHSEVWERPWLNEKEINVTCQNDGHRSKRGLVGGQQDQDPTRPQYRALAEESLRKYVVDAGITQTLAVSVIQKVTTQVVAGSLTRVDFLVTGSSDSTAIKCHSEVWERPWLNEKEINVTCQNDGHRSKRGIPGGLTEQDPTKPQYKALAEESLRKYVVDAGITQTLAVALVERVTTQVVAGSLTRVDFLVTGSSDSTTIKCHSEVWERPWLNKKEINVTCQNDGHRSKRGMPGGLTEKDPTEPQYKALAEESLRKYVVDAGITQTLAVALVERVTTQVVAGSLTRVDFRVTGSSDSTTIKCHSEVWERPWLNKKDINVTCQNDGHRRKRQVVGGLTDQDVKDPKYQALAQQSLRKYTKDSGITQPLEIVRIDKVTTQVVAGVLTRIDFAVSVNLGSTTILCHSKIFEQGWVNHKEIDVSCHDDSHGENHNSFKEQDPSEPRYKAQAEESLQKYVFESGIAEPLEVVRVERAITEAVSGMLVMTSIDFIASGTDDSNSIKCHSDTWDRPTLSQKDIAVSCLPFKERVKRDLLMAGLLAKEWIRGNSSNNNSINNMRGRGEEEQEPNKPEYKQLAEESLRKLYRKKSTVHHKVLEVQRVVTRVVSGFKYKIDFTAAPTSCSVNVSSVRARSCKADDGVVLYCHSEIWDRPWLRQKKIDVQCNDPNENDDFSEYETDNDVTVKPSANPQNNTAEKFVKLAEEASDQYLTSSNRKYVHKVTEIISANEQVADGITNIEFSISPTTCLRNETTNTTSCKLKKPLVVFHCNANIQIRPWLRVEKQITVTCKKNSESKKSKREAVARKIRQVIEDEDEIDEDTTYYYADRAVQHINDRSSSNNLHKLITIHAIQNSVQMGTLTVKMYIEVAETYCLRHHKSKDLRDCEEMSGLNHRLCLARLWPSPDDELVVRHVSVVCDDEEDFVTITGVNIPELTRITVAVLESPAENKYKLIHQGEPQLIPSLDSLRPFKLNLVIALTNCSKDVNLDKNPFQCYLNPNIPPRNCRAFIWLKAEAKFISNVEAHCTPITPRIRRSALDPENVTLDYSELQSLVRASLEQLEMQSLHRYKQRVLQINSHSTRITSGKVTTIDFDVGYTSCLKYEWVANITSCNFLEHLPRRRCVAQIWERLWIKNGKNIDVNCVDDETPLESHIEFESAEMANELARQALKHIEAKYPHPSKQKVVRIFSLEKQVVAGIHYKMKVEIGFTDCLALSDQKDCKLVSNHGLNKFCRINVWIRPWTDHPPNFRVSCDFQEGTTRDLYHHVQAEHLFYNFLTTYSPSYVNDYSQMHKRFEIFKNNIKKIHELNVHEKGTAVYGVTRFTDLTYEEFSTTYMGLNTNLTNENQVPMKQADIPNIKVPANFDWRDYDAVTEVKDQGSCGSCWAFSVTGNIEGQWKMQSGQLVSLSEQELVDCDKLDNGCNGGLPDNAYRAIEQMGGLELESDYPYEGTDDKCVFNKTLARVQISSAVNITTNETAMAQWLVHNGPISIGINANAMQFYMGGISHPWKMLCNPTNLDHGVLIVGYGIKEYPLFHKKLPYWIIKNSWGKSWGEQGYYRVYRGDGTCGVNQMASSAVI